MKKIIGLLFTLCFSIVSSYSQIVKPDEFFQDVQTYDGRVVFIKEIRPAVFNTERNFFIVKEWAKINFGQDPFNSSVNVLNKERKILGKSRVELLLPENDKQVREKIMMKYKIEIFFSGDYCVAEISGISFVNDAKINGNTLKQKFKAEDSITEQAIALNKENSETLDNLRKSTIYYFNDLINSLQDVLSK